MSGFAIGLLVALSVTLEARLFALVPMGALYGMFLYMGVMGLRDLVIVRRLCVLFKRHKHWKVSVVEFPNMSGLFCCHFLYDSPD